MGSAAEGQDSRAPACQDSMSWKLAPNMQKRKQPSWPWPCDLEVNMGCWPCPYLPMTLIWTRFKIIKAVKNCQVCKNPQKRKWPLWPWLWPCDLEVNMGYWPCPYLPIILIWARSKVIKAVKSQFSSLTLDVHYLTLRAKIQHSAS